MGYGYKARGKGNRAISDGTDQSKGYTLIEEHVYKSWRKIEIQAGIVRKALFKIHEVYGY